MNGFNRIESGRAALLRPAGCQAQVIINLMSNGPPTVESELDPANVLMVLAKIMQGLVARGPVQIPVPQQTNGGGKLAQ